MSILIATTARDPDLEKVCGIRRRHAEMLLAFCQGAYRSTQLLVVVRGANPASLNWHGRAGHAPKPYGVDDKTARSGRILPPGATSFYYSDYDLFGVYARQHTGDYVRLYIGNFQPKQNIGTRSLVSPTTNDFLNRINAYVCRRFGDDDMFQHGAEADYLLEGRPKLDLKDAALAAFEHTGKVFVIPGASALKEYYQQRRGLTWAWD